jgi:hypothetical protein
VEFPVDGVHVEQPGLERPPFGVEPKGVLDDPEVILEIQQRRDVAPVQQQRALRLHRPHPHRFVLLRS